MPHWPDELARVVRDAAEAGSGRTLPFGNGRSYGDSCLATSDHVIGMKCMDRMLSADWDSGQVEVQSGMTLETLIGMALPRGWFLPVTPGTKLVTVGGAIANDVHGKNHHVMGTFGRHVRKLSLFRTDRGVLPCSPEENADLFGATIGGLGLTGVVVSAVLQLRRVASSDIVLKSIKFGCLDEFFDLSMQHDALHEYAVAWIDCLAQGKQLGRGHYLLGDHAQRGPLQVVDKRRKSMPVDPPISLVTRPSLALFNFLYFHRQLQREAHAQQNYDSFFYPLDGLLHWNRMYGRRGFQQFQCVIPSSCARRAIGEMLASIAKSGAGSFLAVLKTCGGLASPGLLSFPMEGTSLALDFAQVEPRNSALFRRLDDIVRSARGRLYPAKDAHMSGTDFKEAYPAWIEMERLRDPCMMSRFWSRVTQQS